MQEKNGAQIVIELLERQGVRYIFGIPGGSNLPLYDALFDSKKIEHVLARHEQGAGFMAQGIARSSNLPAVCFATSGPGVTNLLTAVADAYLDSIPLICITGQVTSSLLGTDAFQEVDTMGLTMPITKHNYLVREAADLLTIIPEAFSLAMSGRPGPVLIDIPKDVQQQKINFGSWPGPGRLKKESAPNQRQILRIAEAIEGAERPLICLGGGISPWAAELARALIEKNSLPAVVTLRGLGILPVDHPLYLGMLGMHGAPYTNKLVAECDLFIAVGMRFDDRATGKIDDFCSGAKIIHIDIDQAEINKIRSADLSVVGEAGEVMTKLVPLLEVRRRTAWLNFIRTMRKNFPMPEFLQQDIFIPANLIKSCAEFIGKQAYVSTDVGQHQMWVAQFYPFSFAGQFLTSGGLGTMGFGLPVAIGAALAFPERPHICFSGDGSLLMNIQELATLAELDLNLKIIVFDNQLLGLVHQQQELFYKERYSACEFKNRSDFVTIAKGFGISAFDLGKSNDPQNDLSKALRKRGSVLIRVPISSTAKVLPMVQPGKSNTEMIY